MDGLQQLDSAFFYLINVSWANGFFDVLLPLWRDKLTWIPFYLFVAVFIWQNWKGRRGAVVLLGLVLALGLSDFTSSTIIKKNVQRLRPCNNPEMQALVVQRVSCGSGYSFTSSHAANHFAIALYLSMFFGRLASWIRPVLITWAFLIGYAQVYVGVHYPGDVFAGAILGALIGWGTARFFKPWAGLQIV